MTKDSSVLKTKGVGAILRDQSPDKNLVVKLSKKLQVLTRKTMQCTMNKYMNTKHGELIGGQGANFLYRKW